MTVVEGDLKASFSIATEGEGATPIHGLLHFSQDPWFIKLSVKQSGIVPFLSLWYDSPWN